MIDASLAKTTRSQGSNSVSSPPEVIRNDCHRCGFLTALECIKFISALDPAGKAYSASPGSLADLRRPTFKGKRGKRRLKGGERVRGGGKKRRAEERKGEGRRRENGRKGKGPAPLSQFPESAPDSL